MGQKLEDIWNLPVQRNMSRECVQQSFEHILIIQGRYRCLLYNWQWLADNVLLQDWPITFNLRSYIHNGQRCSTSLVAIHLASQELTLKKKCDLAVCSAEFDIRSYCVSIGYSRSKLLSRVTVKMQICGAKDASGYGQKVLLQLFWKD